MESSPCEVVPVEPGLAESPDVLFPDEPGVVESPVVVDGLLILQAVTESAKTSASGRHKSFLCFVRMAYALFLMILGFSQSITIYAFRDYGKYTIL